MNRSNLSISFICILCFGLCFMGHAQKSQKFKPTLKVDTNSKLFKQRAKFFINPQNFKPGGPQDPTESRVAAESFLNIYRGLLNDDKPFYFTDQQLDALVKELKLTVTNIYDTCQRIRMYPALMDGKLSLIFMAEGCVNNTDGSKAYSTYLGRPWYYLSSGGNGFTKITSTSTARGQILQFQSDYFNDFNLRSLSFSVGEMRIFRLALELNQGGRINNDYGIVLVPCFNASRASTNKLFFTFKETVKVNGTTTTTISENNLWYNHIDPCPDICSTNQIK